MKKAFAAFLKTGNCLSDANKNGFANCIILFNCIYFKNIGSVIFFLFCNSLGLSIIGIEELRSGD